VKFAFVLDDRTVRSNDGVICITQHSGGGTHAVRAWVWPLYCVIKWNVPTIKLSQIKTSRTQKLHLETQAPNEGWSQCCHGYCGSPARDKNNRRLWLWISSFLISKSRLGVSYWAVSVEHLIIKIFSLVWEIKQISYVEKDWGWVLRDSQDSEDVGVVFLGCDAMWTCKYITAFRRNVLSPSSGRFPWNSAVYLRHHTVSQLRTLKKTGLSENGILRKIYLRKTGSDKGIKKITQGGVS
jgi:hypothetical protein